MDHRGLAMIATTRALLLLVCLLMASAGLAAPPVSTERVIRLYNIHTSESADILFKKDGKFIKEGLEKANWLLRDWRRNEPTEMDPQLIDLLWEIHAELGSQQPIHIISGYRSRATNDMLRRTVGGQASESRHILGKAADVYFPDVPLKRLRYSALIHERGGVGYYPTSGTPFVHIDTDRVRAWPRLPRTELALLFPNGQTQHVPADGNPLGPDDFKLARVQAQDLAQEIAAFQAGRRDTRLAEAKPATATRVAAAKTQPNPAEPKLVAAPTPARRPERAVAGVGEADRAALAALVALASAPPVPSPAAGAVPPSSARGAGSQSGQPPIAWLPAPAYDDEHPEELSYRPFEIAPLLADDPQREPAILTALVAPDTIRTLDFIDQAEGLPTMALGPPSRHFLPRLWKVFRGAAVAVNDYFHRR